ncbi:hypothetical protein P154DRAFT_610740 [Amniculicola lignicola CBS 123094]|uniref:DUF7704 domain-containing protein n=1 Tax=Amniculicola lignicola CBS 123094 TaxID=1392246 RepID=A0A6A5W8W2_9PLEO|nr:hypothetical protein P154DRAFT_610740 [Amniculicola lignicola CBS 123094]
MTTEVVPGVYRFFFTWFDPIVSFAGAYMDFAARDLVINSLVPNAPPCNPHYAFIFQRAGGRMLSVSFLSGALLRATDDLKVWKYIQTAILIIDVSTLYSVWDALRVQGRLRFGATRSEDWGTVGITLFATVLRVAFLAGVGYKKRPLDKTE